jgi:DNA-binding transcriptional ArsR family regulator
MPPTCRVHPSHARTIPIKAIAYRRPRAKQKSYPNSPISALNCQRELAKPLPMSLPAAMRHLGVLEAAGPVRSEKVGRVRTCSIEPAALSLAEQWINARRTQWEQRLDCLGAYLAAERGG